MDKSSNTNTSITEFFPLHAFQVLPRHVLIIFLVFIIPSEAQFYVSFSVTLYRSILSLCCYTDLDCRLSNCFTKRSNIFKLNAHSLVFSCRTLILCWTVVSSHNYINGVTLRCISDRTDHSLTHVAVIELLLSLCLISRDEETRHDSWRVQRRLCADWFRSLRHLKYFAFICIWHASLHHLCVQKSAVNK